MTGRTCQGEHLATSPVRAAMEPGRDDREDAVPGDGAAEDGLPQWSPVVMTGRTRASTSPCQSTGTAPQWSPVVMTGRTMTMQIPDSLPVLSPQWSPVVMTGRTDVALSACGHHVGAAMEPGRDDREDCCTDRAHHTASRPQWSPVVMTGRTVPDAACLAVPQRAAMEPGRDDREDPGACSLPPSKAPCRNGARS